MFVVFFVLLDAVASPCLIISLSDHFWDRVVVAELTLWEARAEVLEECLFKVGVSVVEPGVRHTMLPLPASAELCEVLADLVGAEAVDHGAVGVINECHADIDASRRARAASGALCLPDNDRRAPVFSLRLPDLRESPIRHLRGGSQSSFTGIMGPRARARPGSLRGGARRGRRRCQDLFHGMFLLGYNAELVNRISKYKWDAVRTSFIVRGHRIGAQEGCPPPR